MSEEAFLQRVRAAAAAAPRPPSAIRLLLLTGQCRWTASPLSAHQHAFLDAVAAPEIDVVRSGFPFDDEAVPPQDLPPLLLASHRSWRQFRMSTRDPGFRTAAGGAIANAVVTAERGLAIVTGSAGLALLNAGWPLLPLRPGLKVHIVALGPAGDFAPGRTSVEVVQGRRDPWSRLSYQGPVHHRPDCGHLDYWTDPTARAVAAQAVRTVAA